MGIVNSLINESAACDPFNYFRERQVRMFRLSIILSIFILIFTTPLSAQNEAPLTLTVRVEGIAHRKGEVGVALFNNKLGYPVHIEHAYENEWVELKEGQENLEVVFDTIPPGEYAISVMHDENGNRMLERSTMGFPKEGVGFSNDQRVVLSAPKFAKAKFNLSEGEQKKILIKLEYRK